MSKDEKPGNCKVALVNMPIVNTENPSLGLSLLKAELSNRNINSTIHYLNIRYAEKVGVDILYELELIPTAQLIGDWIFSESLWGPDQDRDQAYIDQVLRDKANEHPHHENGVIPEAIIPELWKCRAAVEPFIEESLNQIDWSQYKIVGFTSMFQQHIAALSFAQKLKQKFPHLMIVFGGANCADDMGRALIENFDFVDAVSLGMGDHVFADFCEAILSGNTPHSDKDFLIRGTIPSLPNSQSHVENMNELPFPDFDDFFFQRVDQSSLPHEHLSMLVETSRGCWWGQKHHCTFCGLNNATMNYRFKSAERAMAEFEYLTNRYGKYTTRIAVVDNIIPMDYLRSFLPKLRDSEMELDIFYETKANLKKEHLQLYSEAGLYSIQPGIESFSNRLLKLMKKGISGLQNVQFLKWCREFGVKPMWNYLVGFPGEHAHDHYQQLSWFPLLSHLYPPDVSWIRIDRFSPYHTNHAQYGISKLRPFSAFKFLYPELPEEQRDRVAYYFIGEYEVSTNMFEYSEKVNNAVKQWRAAFDYSALFYFDDGEKLTIVDDRDCAVNGKYIFTEIERFIYLECDQIRSIDKLFTSVQALYQDLTFEQYQSIIQSMVDNKIMLEDEGKIVALAVSVEYEYFPPQNSWQKVAEVLL